MSVNNSKLFSLSGKTAVITGASKGIGRSIAEVFAGHGAEVHIFDINNDAGAEVVDGIEKQGGKAYYHHADVGSQTKIHDVTNGVYRQSGRLDILVNNAGIVHIGKLEETSEADFDRVYQANVKGVYNCSHAAIGHMKKTGGGVILNMASVVASVGIDDRFAYSMSKGAVLTMTYSIAKDYIRQGIRCNAISPARVHTPFVDGYLKQNYPGKEKEMFDKLSATQPIGRMGQAEEIAHMALYLCSDEASFVTGSNFPIDGGFITLNT